MSNTLKKTEAVLAITNRDWFRGMGEFFGGAMPHSMLLLLLWVFVSAKKNSPMSKKEAWSRIGLLDIKTGRKYIGRAIELGLIHTQRSKHDRRKELLYPTAKLERLLELEMKLIQNIEV